MSNRDYAAFPQPGIPGLTKFEYLFFLLVAAGWGDFDQALQDAEAAMAALEGWKK